MTVEEKLDVMEKLWVDLSRDDAAVESPAWHEAVLREREIAVREGREVPLDWETAKRKLFELR